MTPDYSWTPAPVVLILVALSATVYTRRWLVVRRSHHARGAPVWKLVSFHAGLVVVLIALVSPVDALGEQLAAMHMVQHMLLLDIAPILCTLGLTKVLLRPVTRRVQRIERAAGPLGHPATAVLLYAGLLWLWHVPLFYDAALENVQVHVIEHTCFTFVGILYWWHLLSPIRSRFHLAGVQPIVYMASTKLLVGMLGMLLTFAPRVIYSYHGGIWGMSALDDQAVAGAIMTTEQGIVMGVALCALFARALLQSEREQQRAEALEDRQAEQAQALEPAPRAS